MMKEVFLRRIEAVRANMKKAGVDLLIITPSSYMKYLTGYSIKGDERFLCFALPCEGEAFSIGNKLYEQQMADIPAAEFYFWNDGEDGVELLGAKCGERSIKADTIAIDPNMPAMFTIKLLRAFPGAELRSAAELIDGLRIYKDEAERASMREACRRADLALKNTVGEDPAAWIGKSEEEFLAKLVYEMTKLGIMNGAACVCVGENASEPHHHPDKSLIEKGKCLLIDFGGDFENYNTDMTRDLYFGEPSEEYLKVYDILLTALSKGKEAARIGAKLQDVDRAVRGYITEQGYGEYFTHRTGHGIGIDCHEGPSAMEGEETLIAPGMCFSIEPGVYIPGRFGIRIEDQMMVTEEGAGALHSYPLELQVVRC